MFRPGQALGETIQFRADASRQHAPRSHRRAADGRRRLDEPGSESADVRRALSAAVPLHAGRELDERPQWARLLQGRVPSVLPIQSIWYHVGPHELGARRQHRPRALAAPAPGHPGGEWRDGFLRQCGCRLEQHQRVRSRRRAPAGGDLHGSPRGKPVAGHRLQQRPPVDGDTEKTRWVLIVNLNPGAIAGGSGTQYFVGDFDGSRFTTASSGSMPVTLWADYGKDFYAAVSWSDIPPRDGRRLWIGWMNNWQYGDKIPTSPWRSAQSVPRTLALRTTEEGIRLVQQPVSELRRLRGMHRTLGPRTIRESTTTVAGITGNE